VELAILHLYKFDEFIFHALFCSELIWATDQDRRKFMKKQKFAATPGVTI
jgi:hypothetical protein